MSTMVISATRERDDSALVLPAVAGFFFAFRIGLTYLFFQSNPVLGSTVSIGIDFALVFAAILSMRATTTLIHGRAMKGVFTFLAFTLLSLSWTKTDSTVAAASYWAGMAGDVGVVLLLMRGHGVLPTTQSLIRGTVWGTAAISFAAWCSPLTSELRLGNDLFLHPNTLGWMAGIAILLAQYLAPQGRRWTWLGLGLSVTLLRTFSKTAILAFVAAEAWYLIRNSGMSRKTKMQIVASAAILVACFWGAAAAYATIYNNTGSGNQAQTLTGRTVLWATALVMSVETPWLGHGMYSFRSLIPSFGNFSPVHAHNEALQLFFEFGLCGLGIAVFIYCCLYRDAKRADRGELRLLAFALLIFSLLHGVTDTVPFGLSYPLWLIATVSLCLSDQQKGRLRV